MKICQSWGRRVMTLGQKYEEEYRIVNFLLDIILKQNLNIYIVIFCKHLSGFYWIVLMFF